MHKVIGSLSILTHTHKPLCMCVLKYLVFFKKKKKVIESLGEKMI